MEATSQWPVLQLAEFVAVVTATPDEESLVRAAIERAAEAVDAEVGALLSVDEVIAAVGYGSQEPDGEALRAVAHGATRTLAVPGCGTCPALAVPLDTDPGGMLVLARSGPAFTGEEQALLRGMGRVLTLVLQLVRVSRSEANARADASRLQADLEERRVLLEHLLAIQHSIAEHVPTDEIFDAVAAGARALLGGTDTVGVRLVRADDHDMSELVALAGADRNDFERLRPVAIGVSGRAIVDQRLVVAAHYGDDEAGDPRLAELGLQSAMAAPVYQDGKVAGSLVVSTVAADRVYSTHEQDVLLLFAEHVSLALNDDAARRAMANALDEAVHRATHDQLTGLPNRTLVLDRLEGALARAARSGLPVTVFFVDLDRFKMVNDFLGHQRGDHVLTMVAARLHACIRPSDTVGRLSGDEFVVLCEGLDELETDVVAARMAQAIAAPMELSGHDTRITASIGIARGGDGARAEHVLGDADVALYRAKERGRARVEHFDHTLREQMQHRLRTEQALRAALPADELLLYYQPTVWSPTGAVIGMEALLRWQHPERGLVSPEEFIDVAEETGLIVPIGAWVLEQACLDAVRWQREGPGMAQVSLSVNLSARQLADPTLAETVAGALERSGLRSDNLWLELTESALMEDAEATLVMLEALRAAGVRLAIDDFGTGYSSLSYLRRFQVDALKIDRSFVDGVADDTEAEAIVRAVLRMADALGLTTVAEGVETVRQGEALAALGCFLCQGFLYARPAPVDVVLRGLPGSIAHLPH
jgi:diguanylate cyclase (GGDEF)-like protein